MSEIKRKNKVTYVKEYDEPEKKIKMLFSLCTDQQNITGCLKFKHQMKRVKLM